MEKVIRIDDKEVRLKITGGTTYRYKAQTGREYLTDVIELEEKQRICTDESGKLDIKRFISVINLNVIYEIIWAMAKTADDTIPDPLSWLDTFEKFPVFSVWSDIRELLFSNAKVDRKNV
ncbi:MAG: hypothetical protein IJ007_05010 [Oscillospiraceae bacterium]|nr:hypothetical protein [Oscillospiraceae bacterium]